MCSTVIAYGGTERGTAIAYGAMRCAVYCDSVWCYALRGIEIAYGGYAAMQCTIGYGAQMTEVDTPARV
eukprot:2033063-Rhodomonas_salina.1